MPDAVEVGRILIGRCYRHHHLKVVRSEGERVVMDVQFGVYKTLSYVFAEETRQEMLLLEGQDGADKGKLIVVSQYRFCLCFDLLQQFGPPVPDDPPGKAEEGKVLNIPPSSGN